MTSRIRKSITALSVLGASAALLVGSAGVAQAATWKSYTWDNPNDGDKGGVSVGAGIYKVGQKEDFYEVLFRAKGETLVVWDSTPDKKKAKAYLKVEGEGTATFTNHYKKEHPNSFDEGKDVQVKICIEGTSTCSDWSPVGTT